MTRESMTRFHRIYSILLSIVIIISGICLIAACISIYQMGEHPFSRQAVADAFSGIAFPVYLCLTLIILGFILDVIMPADHISSKNKMPSINIYKVLYSKKDFSRCDENLLNDIYAHQKKRRLHSIIRTVVLSISSIVFLIYALNGAVFYKETINDTMIHAMYVLIPCLAVSFCYTLFTVYYNEKSIKQELELIKQVPSATDNSADDCSSSDMAGVKMHIIRFSVLFIALFILIYGFISGGTADVLTKAANICTECIGLG